MNPKIPLSAVNILGLFLVLAVLYFSTLYNFLLFHTLAEFFSIVVAFAIFIIAWNTRQIQNNRYFLFLGIAYLYVGFIDLAHTGTYKGLMIFHAVRDADTPTQLWIIGRYIESISLFIAPLFFSRRIRPFLIISLYTLITGLLLWSIYADVFPVCFVEGEGLTPFKKISEYVICIILIGAFFTLHANRVRFSPHIFALLTASIILTIFSELAFTFYVGVYDLSNIIGHFLKFISFYLIYKALVETGLKEPYEFLFKELTESEEKYRTLFTNMLNGVAYHKVVLDDNNLPVDHIFLDVNDAFEQMLGLSKKDIVGKKVTEVFLGVQDSDFDFIGEFGNVALTGETLHTEQYFAVMERWYSFSVYSPAKGYFAVVFEDITSRKMAELDREEYLKKVDVLMAELERSNQDLQQFANIVSHDLQEPLRTVSSFVKLLSRRYQGKLDEKADSYINFIVEGTARMHTLLNEMLAFARLGGGQLYMQPLELRAVLDRVLMNLRDSIDTKQAEIICVEPLPQVTADETQLMQLFQNLIANALKFSGKDRPSIVVSAAFSEKEWVVCVQDNGIGINPKDIDRIFLMFQRLHPRKEYEGTGLGLAQCKKIVERHGGKIWAESIPGRGSSFYFSISEP